MCAEAAQVYRETAAVGDAHYLYRTPEPRGNPFAARLYEPGQGLSDSTVTGYEHRKFRKGAGLEEFPMHCGQGLVLDEGPYAEIEGRAFSPYIGKRFDSGFRKGGKYPRRGSTAAWNALPDEAQRRCPVRTRQGSDAHPAVRAARHAADKRPGMSRIKAVEYAYRYRSLHGRPYRRRIEHLRSRLGKPQGRLVRNIRNRDGRGYNLGVGSHYSRDIRPYLDDGSVGACRIQGRTVVGTAPAERSGPAVGAGSYETRRHEKPCVGTMRDAAPDIGIAPFFVHAVFRADDKFPRVYPLRADSFAGALARYDPGGEQLPEADRLPGRSGEQSGCRGIEFGEGLSPFLSGEEPVYYRRVPVPDLGRDCLPQSRVAAAVELYEPVGAAAHGGAHEDHPVP